MFPIIKRILPLVLIVALLICLLAVSVSADTIDVDGNTVIDYLDYVSGYDLTSATDGWAYIRVDPELMGTVVYDPIKGERELYRGTQEFTLQCDTSGSNVMAAASFYPGSYVNNSYLRLDNIPSGSKFWLQTFCDVLAGTYQTDLVVFYHSGIQYFDSDFVLIDFYHEYETRTISGEDVRLTDIVELTIDKPENAAYCVFNVELTFQVLRSNDYGYIPIRMQFDMPSLKIATTYTQLIVEAIINSKKPVGSDGIVGVDELEDFLKDQTSDGRVEFDEIVEKSPELITLHASGFLFIASVCNILFSAGWLNGVLTISLSLGILGFIGNFVSSAGRALEHRSKGGKF